MKTHRLSGTILCIYEFFRLFFIVGVYSLFQPEQKLAFPWMAMIAPAAMFFLMALFLCIDSSRYRTFCPLYIAGKGLVIITTMIWHFFIRTDTINEASGIDIIFITMPLIVFFMVIVEILSAMTAYLILRSREVN